MTTLQLLLNSARALHSEWPMQVQMDGSYDFCDSKLGRLGVIVFGVNSLRGKFRPVSWFAFIYNGVREYFFSVLEQGALRLCPPGQGCELYDQIRDLQSSPEVAAVLDEPTKKLPVK
jgi:hypothetical protein